MIDQIKEIAMTLSQHSGWVTLMGVVIILIITIFSKKTNTERATLATSVGIAFTFLGITIGLLVFDIKNIDSSVEDLINGLQIAFITSLVGVVCATVLKFMHKREEVSTKKTDNELLQQMAKSLDALNKNLYGEEDGSLIGQIKNMRQDNQDQNKELVNSVNVFAEGMTKSLDTITTNLYGEEEGSLLGQIKNMRQDNQDQNKKLIESVNAFADKVAKNQTEELVKALENVLQTLEKTIQEKLGESFKQFSESVDNLVKWQDGYKDNIDQTQQILNQVKDSMKDTSESFEKIADQNRQVQQIQENLKGTIELLSVQLKTINEQVEILSKLPDNFKSIASNIEKVGQDMETATQTHNEQTEKIVKSIESNIEKVGKDMEGASQAHHEQMEKIITSMASSIEKMIQDVEKNSNEITTNYNALTKEMQEQIPKLANELDGALGSMIGGFRDKMEEIVQHVNDIRRTPNKNNE